MPAAGVPRRLVVWLGLALLVLYSLWLGGPYLRSIAVRDAAVTTWLHVANSPIAGLVAGPVPVGGRIGADGRIFTVTNPRADTVVLARARADLEQARARVTSLAGIAGQIDALVAARAAVASDYAATFKRNMDVYVAGLTDDLALSRRRLELERAEAQRVSAIAARGAASQSAVEAASSRVADLERTVVGIQSKLDQAVRNRRGADQGLFFLDDGSDGSTAQRTLEDARLNLQRVRADLANAQKDADAAQRVVDEALRLYGQGQTANAEGLPGGTVWSQTASHGAAVEPGTPAASWVDCRVLLVDTPASDAELSLLRPGLPAVVVLEGERRSRRGTVLLIRGAAATLGSRDLAAVAKGRRPGVGQALVTLEATPADVEACPIGRAAFVHFPDVTVLDIVRARLRW